MAPLAVQAVTQNRLYKFTELVFFFASNSLTVQYIALPKYCNSVHALVTLKGRWSLEISPNYVKKYKIYILIVPSWLVQVKRNLLLQLWKKLPTRWYLHKLVAILWTLWRKHQVHCNDEDEPNNSAVTTRNEWKAEERRQSFEIVSFPLQFFV